MKCFMVNLIMGDVLRFEFILDFYIYVFRCWFKFCFISLIENRLEVYIIKCFFLFYGNELWYYSIF